MARRRQPPTFGVPDPLMAGAGELGGPAPIPGSPPAHPRDVGLRVIIVYKLAKAAVQAALAATLPILRRLGVTTYWAVAGLADRRACRPSLDGGARAPDRGAF